MKTPRYKNVMTVMLNGMDTNPYSKYGVRCNPFPQIAKYETQQQIMRVQELGATPIPDTNFIRNHLKGYASEELIDLCCKQFQKGQYVEFMIGWND